MNKLSYLIILALGAILTNSVSAVTLTSFGNVDTPTFVDIGSSFTLDNQGASSLDISGNDSNTLAGDFGNVVNATVDIADATDLVLTGSIATAPTTTFTIRLYDENFNTIDYTGGSWVDLNSMGKAVLSLGSPNLSFDASKVTGMDLIANGFGTNSFSATLTDLSFAVPEPSTAAALVGLAALGTVMVRRRRR